jgi:hypothetical protein
MKGGDPSKSDLRRLVKCERGSGRGRSMSGWLGAPGLLPTLLPTQAQPGTTKALLLAVVLGRFRVLCCAWYFLVVVDPLSGASYESVGRTFESCRAHQPDQ